MAGLEVVERLLGVAGSVVELVLVVPPRRSKVVSRV